MSDTKKNEDVDDDTKQALFELFLALVDAKENSPESDLKKDPGEIVVEKNERYEVAVLSCDDTDIGEVI